MKTVRSGRLNKHSKSIRKSSHSRQVSPSGCKSVPFREDHLGFSRFDICCGVPMKVNARLLTKDMEEMKELEHYENDLCVEALEPGMILLKNYISHSGQVKIIKRCRELGLGSGGFYQPRYRHGAKLHLKMMCLGRIWDPERLYEDRFHKIDGAEAPSIPDEFKHLVKGAIKTSHFFLKHSSKLSSAENILPRMSPDICIVNFYKRSGKLGLHQDSDESQESICKGLPVVSFSIGDSAEFLYGFDRHVNKAKKVLLESGDVIIFGGESRLIFHGVSRVLPNTAPRRLLEETNLLPGRLNLTFRQY
ncbi:DNA N(6)-methyladenine demethylase ALKBH1C-like [Tasmannia lanceolata]|uniref:DNA N(6)-methyladenine demethylase ALKBH1C-like n=1 Tax=Tasmannia lanceolata TaxID=3420 RepID=UPI004062B7F2